MLAIPNFSEGRDRGRIRALGEALASTDGVRLLDVHSDPDHNRSVYTLTDGAWGGVGEGAAGQGAAGHGAARQGAALAEALTAGAAAAIELLDIAAYEGLHPHIGTLDVAPVVYMDEPDRGRACALALVLAERLGGELGIPVFLYGVLTEGRVTRAAIRRGGPRALQARIDSGELVPDFGPRQLHARAGAALVAARPPLIAFNVELAAPATLETARLVAALIREGGAEGLPAVRAIAVTLPHRDNVPQVSINIDDYRQTGVAAVVQAIARHAVPLRGEVVGVPPRAAFDGFPTALPVAGLRYLEDALETAAANAADSGAWTD